MSMMMGEDFQYVLRILGTNVDGRQKVMYAMTSVKGIGRRLSCLICKKADVDLNKRAGELTNDEVDTLITIVQNPRQYKIPDWFLNRQKDNKDGKYSQVRRATRLLSSCSPRAALGGTAHGRGARTAARGQPCCQGTATCGRRVGSSSGARPRRRWFNSHRVVARCQLPRWAGGRAGGLRGLGSGGGGFP